MATLLYPLPLCVCTDSLGPRQNQLQQRLLSVLHRMETSVATCTSQTQRSVHGTAEPAFAAKVKVLVLS